MAERNDETLEVEPPNPKKIRQEKDQNQHDPKRTNESRLDGLIKELVWVTNQKSTQLIQTDKSNDDSTTTALKDVSNIPTNSKSATKVDQLSEYEQIRKTKIAEQAKQDANRATNQKSTQLIQTDIYNDHSYCIPTISQIFSRYYGDQLSEYEKIRKRNSADRAKSFQELKSSSCKNANLLQK